MNESQGCNGCRGVGEPNRRQLSFVPIPGTTKVARPSVPGIQGVSYEAGGTWVSLLVTTVCFEDICIFAKP